MNLHVGRVLTDQVIVVLEAAGLTVGRAHAPASVPAGSGYVVVYPLAGGTTDGDIYNPNDDALAYYQMTCIGSDARQAEWISDKVRVTIMSATFNLGDRKVIEVEPVMLGGLIRNDAVQPPNFYTTDRYTLWTSPA